MVISVNRLPLRDAKAGRLAFLLLKYWITFPAIRKTGRQAHQPWKSARSVDERRRGTLVHHRCRYLDHRVRKRRKNHGGPKGAYATRPKHLLSGLVSAGAVDRAISPAAATSAAPSWSAHT
jgi:hypothetical protein